MKIKIMLILFLVFSAFVLFISCGTVDYIGKTYTATNKVDVFYTFDEVLIDHTVFGHITTSPGLLEDMQKKLEIEAMKRGADAIVITGIDRDTGEETSSANVKAALIKYLK